MTKMNCSHANSQMHRHVDGQLSHDEARLLYAHITECESCAADWDSLSRVDALLKSALTNVTPPEDFCAAVMSRINAASNVTPLKKSAIKSPVWKRYGIAGAAAALFFAVGMTGLFDPAINPLPNSPIEITVPPIETSVPIDPMTAPIEPTSVPVDPTRVPIDPTTVPVDPTSVPVDPTSVPVEPPDPPETGIGQVPMPDPASLVQLENVFEQKRLTSDRDAFAPYFNEEGNIEFLAVTDGEYLIYGFNSSEGITVSESGLPAQNLLDKLTSKALTPEEGFVIAVSPDSTMVAFNDGREESVLRFSDKFSSDDTILTDNAGGKILSWAPNSGKFVYTDKEGILYVVYPHEELIIPISKNPVFNVGWSFDSRVLLFDTLSEDGKSRDIIAMLIP